MKGMSNSRAGAAAWREDVQVRKRRFTGSLRAGTQMSERAMWLYCQHQGSGFKSPGCTSGKAMT